MRLNGALLTCLVLVESIGCTHDSRATTGLLSQGQCEDHGGGGGFNSVHAKVTAAIAAGQYQQAREFLELAADTTAEEKAALEQAISAAERGLMPLFENNLPHIFRQALGHFPVDTPQARETIQTTVSKANLLGTDRFDNDIYSRLLDNGTQVWVQARDGFIRDAGFNLSPEPLSRLVKK